MYISASTNLQKESLWQEIITSVKQYGKTEKKYNEKYICCFFTIWNIKSVTTDKCGQVVLFLTSVYFVLSQLILLFSYSLNIPCIILSNVYFYIVSFMFPFIFNWSQSKASNANQMSHSSFEAQNFFCSFQLFKNGHIHNVVSTLINVMKLDVENNSIVLTLSNVININVKMLIWRFSTLQISKLTYQTFFLCWFDIVRRRNVISHKQQHWNQVERFLGYWRMLLKDYIIL